MEKSIKKVREIPIRILKLEALLRRLLLNHFQRIEIEKELARRYAGYRGEQALDYYISQIPQKDMLIFQDLRLPHSKDFFFQLDVLLLSPQLFIILEAKNIGGTIFIDENQLVRTLGDKEESFPNPIQQVENQQYHLGNLIDTHTNSRLPNTSFVVMTNSSAIIKPNPNYRAAAQKVIRPPAIRQRVDSFRVKYQKELIDKKMLQKLSRLLIKMHTPEDPDVVAQFQIDKNEIINGICCQQCLRFSVIKSQRVWICNNCRDENKYAHIQALIDYCLLYGPTITTKQCSTFLKLTSSVSSKLLRSLNLNYIGENRLRTYELQFKNLLQKMKHIAK